MWCIKDVIQNGKAIFSLYTNSHMELPDIFLFLLELIYLLLLVYISSCIVKEVLQSGNFPRDLKTMDERQNLSEKHSQACSE